MLSLSRRRLLATASSVLLSRNAEPNSSSLDGGEPSRGRINLGLNGLTYYMAFYSFLNAWKSGAPIQVINNGMSYWSNIPPGSANSAWGIFLDKNGELVSPLPSNTIANGANILFFSARWTSDGYNRIGEQWILKWDGIASDGQLSCPRRLRVRVGNRIEWVWSVNEGDQRVVFSDIDLNDPPRNIRLCEARHEALLDAGELFNPDWLAKVREGSGIIRFMDWQSTNGNLSTLHFSDIPDENYCSYGGDSKTPLIRGGLPVTIMSALANKVQSHPWVCIPHVFGTRKLTAINKYHQGQFGRRYVARPQLGKWRQSFDLPRDRYDTVEPERLHGRQFRPEERNSGACRTQQHGFRHLRFVWVLGVAH